MLPFAYIFSLYVANVQVTHSRILCQDPLGVLQCKVNCKQVTGCDRYGFEHKYLKCCIGSNGTDLKQGSGVVRTINRTKTTPSPGQGCTGGSRIIQARKNSVRCLTVEKRVIRDSSPKSSPDQIIYPITDKILVAFKDGKHAGPIHILNLTSGVLTEYQNMFVPGICAMIFNKVSNTLYYANSFSWKIMKVVLSKQEIVVVKKRIRVWAMAMDEDGELLFVSQKKRIGFLDGSVYKKIISTKEQADFLAVDPKQRKIYASGAFYIYVITYEGRSSQFLAYTGKGPLALDPSTHMLCYCREIMFVLYNLTSGSQIWNHFLPVPATNIEIKDGLIYATLKGPKVTIFVDEDHKYKHVHDYAISNANSDALSAIIY